MAAWPGCTGPIQNWPCVPHWRRRFLTGAMRTDPLLKLVCGRTPDSSADLASQPTLSRLENAVSARTCYRLAQALFDVYLQERERANRGSVPAHVLLDLDGTDDPTHRDQEGNASHGY